MRFKLPRRLKRCKVCGKGLRPKKINNLLAKITEEEIVHLCKIFEINNEKPEINLFLKNILEKHPDVAFGFAQALEKIK